MAYIPWPQHPTEPRFSHAETGQGCFTFTLSNEISGEERRERFSAACLWCLEEFGPPELGVWKNYPLVLMLRIERPDLATHFRLRWC